MATGSEEVRRGDAGGSVTGPPDMVVVGGGAAGLAAATAAHALGAAVRLVAEGPLGGDCTWHGCVPTKSVLEAAGAGLDAGSALAHARSVVARVARTESETALRGAGVDVVRDRAGLLPGARVRLSDGTVLAPTAGVVLATGSRPLGADRLGLALTAGQFVSTTDGWLEAVQDHLDRAGSGPRGPVVVLGGGASGVELAQALARLRVGGEAGVVLLERERTLLTGVPGAGDVVAAALRADGVRVVTGAGPEVLPSALRDGARDVAHDGAPQPALLLLAAGREPVTDALQDPAVARRDRGLVVDAAMRTTAARVCAAGDVTGLRPSTHVAVATGRVAAATLLGHRVSFDPTWVPEVVYTDPEVAVVGAPESPDAPEGTDGTDGLVSRRVRLPLSRNDRALTAALPGGGRAWTRGGFVQLRVVGVPDPRRPDGPLVDGGCVAGAVLVGPGAGELVSEVALVGRLGLTVAQWSGGRTGLGGLSAQHAYPSWSWVWEAVTDRLLGR